MIKGKERNGGQGNDQTVQSQRYTYNVTLAMCSTYLKGWLEISPGISQNWNFTHRDRKIYDPSGTTIFKGAL